MNETALPDLTGRRIDNLEERLGVKLLHRTTRHLSLTEQGTIFLKHCQNLLAEIDSGEMELFPEAASASC